jgi:hypothetical protein
MKKKLLKYYKIAKSIFVHCYDHHPYMTSLEITLVFVGYLLFNTPYLAAVNSDMPLTHNISFVDMQEIKLPKRKTKKKLSTESSDTKVTEETLDRATGLSDDSDAVDLALFSNVVPPKLIGGLKNRHPKEARKRNIEATTYIELLIDAAGKVLNVNILAVRLNKELPEDLYKMITAKFVKAVKEMFLERRFTTTLINGEAKPIKLNQKINFKLE